MRNRVLQDFLKDRGGGVEAPEYEAFRESYALLSVIFDQAFQLMALLKPDGTVLKINQRASRSLGGKEPEVIGRPFWETPWWADEPAQRKRLREGIRSAAGGAFVRFDATHKTHEGRALHVDFSLKPVRDDRGNVVLLVAEGRDITERKVTEEALREAAVKYQIVANNTYNWEFWSTPEGRFLYTSPSCLRISGHSAWEFNADPDLLSSIIHPEDRPLWTRHGQRDPACDQPEEIEFRIVRPDGEVRWLHHVCLPVFDENGIYQGRRGSFSDVTGRRLADEKNLRLAAVVECSDDAVIGKTVDGVITSWNRGAERIFGYPEQEVLGRHVTILVPDPYREQVRDVHQRVRAGEHVEHFETVSRRKDGELIHLSLTYSPIRDPQGRVVAVSTIGRDITEQKKAALALLDNARIKRELEIAKEIQQSLLPACPRGLPGVLTACRCVPATHVGGDYYDFFLVQEGVIDVVIADVTGHSVGSALLMAMTRSVLHAKVSSSRSPAGLLAAVNALLYDDLSRAELQISMFCARLDTRRMTLSYANAGHNPPLLFRSRRGGYLELDAEGLLMGVKSEVRFEERTSRVESGDILALYTDGVTEAENGAGEAFGVARLSSVIAEKSSHHPEEIMAALFGELASFTGTEPLLDDVAMTIYKVA